MGGILTDLRAVQLIGWFEQQFGFSGVKLEVLSADASFRRYFRFKTANTSYVLVDAPANTENYVLMNPEWYPDNNTEINDAWEAWKANL